MDSIFVNISDQSANFSLAPQVKIDLSTGKIFTIISMAVLASVFMTLPHKMISAAITRNFNFASRTRWSHNICVCNTVTFGVFLAVSLLELLPSAERNVEEVWENIKNHNGINLEYPVTQLVIASGIFVALIINQIESRVHLPNPADNRDILEEMLLIEDTDVTEVPNTQYKMSTPQSGIFIFSLCIHSVFECIYICRQEVFQPTLFSFILLHTHKAILAFSLGLHLAQSCLSTVNKMLIWVNIAFIFSGPLCILLLNMWPFFKLYILVSLVQGIAAGSFLYTTLLEVMPVVVKDKSHEHQLRKVMMVFFGAALTTTVVILQ